MSEPTILAETDRWFVLNKPAGWLTIPAAAPKSGARPAVLVDWAREKTGQLWVVHRLDRDTSGVVLFAKSADAHREASMAFQERENRKQYDCIAAGQPSAPTFKVNSPVEDKPSVSQIEVKERFAESFLARVRPSTGRRHQIRIHLAGSGYPICGDTLYGGPSNLSGLTYGRVALHAALLELPTGERFEAPWPEDFSAWIEKLRGVAGGR
jgi:23S rRNA-/tRNA-specific pseudouridylate synthase